MSDWDRPQDNTMAGLAPRSGTVPQTPPLGLSLNNIESSQREVAALLEKLENAVYGTNSEAMADRTSPRYSGMQEMAATLANDGQDIASRLERIVARLGV